MATTMIEFLFWPILIWSVFITGYHAYCAYGWKKYHDEMASRKSTEVQDAIKASMKAGLDPDKSVIIKDGKVIHTGEFVSERTKNRVNAPAPGVMRNH